MTNQLILRRPSLGVEPTSPAPSSDRLSVSFAMENVVVENEEEEQDVDKGPLSKILGFQSFIRFILIN